MKLATKNTIIDLGKVSYADLVWRRDGSYPYHELNSDPDKLGYAYINAERYNLTDLLKLFHAGQYTTWTVYTWIKVGRVTPDTFTQVCKLQLSNNHSIEVRGPRAAKIYGAYLARLKVNTKSKQMKPVNAQMNLL